MAIVRCPQCKTPMTDEETRVGTCPSCGAALQQGSPSLASSDAGPNESAKPAERPISESGLMRFMVCLAVAFLIAALPAASFGFRGTRWARDPADRYTAMTAFALVCISFAVLLFQVISYASSGRSARQLSWRVLIFAFLGAAGTLAGVVGMVVLKWDPRIWWFAAGIVVLTLILIGISLAVQRSRESGKQAEWFTPTRRLMPFLVCLGVGILIVGLIAILAGDFTLYGGRGGGAYQIRGDAATGFGISCVSFAMLLFQGAWVAKSGRSSVRQLTRWELFFALIGVSGAAAGIVGMVVLQWDPLIWAFAGGFVVLVLVVSLAVKKG